MNASARLIVSALMLGSVLGAHGAAAPPSAAELLNSYVDWVQNRSASASMVAVDLDAARRDLDRVASTFLIAPDGKVSGLRGSCPSLSFAVGGTPVAATAATRYDGIDCGRIANGVSVRVARAASASSTAVLVSASAPGTPQSGGLLPDERQRRLLTAFALELAKTGSTTQSGAAAQLVEWACPYVRDHAPANDFDRAWHAAALAVLEGGINGKGLSAHLSHVPAALADDPRVVLARGIAEEQISAPSEAGQPIVDPTDRGAINRYAADRAKATQRAIELFIDATRLPQVAAEATLRLGHIELQNQRFETALGLVSDVEKQTSDRVLIYLARLFRGLALDGLNRPADAKAAYQQALLTSPGAHSATMRLATLAFRTGERTDAGQLMQTLLADDRADRDPWWSYYAGDWRFWYPNIERVRTLAGGR